MDTTPSMDKLRTVNQLRSLCTKLEAESNEMKEAIEKLEQGRRERDEARKKLLLAEIKAVIATMHETDKNLIKDMKSEVFDKLRDISKVEKDAKDIIDALKTTNEKDMDIVEDSVKELMKKVERLQVMKFNRCLGLEVRADPHRMAGVARALADTVVLASPGLDPAAWALEVDTAGQSKYLEARLRAVTEGAACSRLLEKWMQLKVVGRSGEVLEETCLEAKMERQLAQVVTSAGRPCYVVRVRRPLVAARLSVTLMSSNVVCSPWDIQTTRQDVTKGEETYGPDSTCINVDFCELEETVEGEASVWEARPEPVQPQAGLAGRQGEAGVELPPGLDWSDYRSLDLTGRPATQGQDLRDITGGNYNSPIISSQRVSRPPCLAAVAEVSTSLPADGPAASSGLDVTAFSPASGTTSTHGSGMLQQNLASALDGLSVQLEAGERTELCASLLGPRSGLALEDVQRSLSSDGSLDTVDPAMEDQAIVEMSPAANNRSSAVNKSMAGNKSVLFAERTEIQQLLATPQVKPGGSKFRTVEGTTKTTDGRQELSRRLLVEQAATGASDVTLPLPAAASAALSVTTDQSILQTTAVEDRVVRAAAYTTDILEELLPYMHDDQDPHLLLNASKAPTPVEWTSPTSSEWEGRGEVAMEVEHLDTFGLNNSILPMELLGKEDWEAEVVEAVAPEQGLAFASGLRRSGGEVAVVNPCDVAYIPAKDILLVSEPKEGRIGIYRAAATGSLEFVNWCKYPFVFRDGKQQQQRFVYPTNLLCTKEGFVFIMEKHRLLILDPVEFKLHQPPIRGNFSGLVQEQGGTVCTLEQVGSDLAVRRLALDTSARGLRLYGRPLYWWTAHRVHLTVRDSFPHSGPTRCWFLAALGSKLVISDFGLHKIYTVELEGEGRQEAFGHMGEGEGQLRMPAGVLVDDRGNLLVSDSGNCRLSVFSPSGTFLRVAAATPGHRPFGLVRKGNTVVVCAPSAPSQEGAATQEGEVATADTKQTEATKGAVITFGTIADPDATLPLK